MPDCFALLVGSSLKLLIAVCHFSVIVVIFLSMVCCTSTQTSRFCDNRIAERPLILDWANWMEDRRGGPDAE